MRRNLYFVFAALLSLTLILSACAAPAAEPTAMVEEEPTQAPVEPTEEAPTAVPPEVPADAPTEEPAAETSMVELPEVNPADVPADAIYTAGSSTVYPVAEAIAQLFVEDGFEGEIKIDSIGSGAGFERFCKTGETDISNASRGIKDSEVESCAALSPARTPLEFRVGTDAIAIVVNPENDFLTDVTSEQLAMIFSDKATNWSDVNPEWPAEPIVRYVPGTDSGTFDFFVENIMLPAYEKDAEKADAAFLQAANLNQSEDDNVLVQGIAGDQYSIGFFGFAYFAENQDSMAVVTLNGVEPNFDTAESGDYALSRPLFIYSDAEVMKAKPQVAAFINFFLSNVNEIISEVGYFPASDEALNEARQTWLDAMQ